MARPVKFTREMIVDIAKRFYGDTERGDENFFKKEGIDRSGFYKLMKKYEIQIKINVQVC
ncbi:hypothetical protein ACPTRW_001030 [Escherichia coli]|uniref:hypothetical protein n=1 Tax=Enterobacteriaceae TaxID=543 RepID=UPI00094BD382|nr:MULTISPECIES: hypothetical protein [Enterobacteriaceae]EFA4047228.1 hypothetical protein [Escherichia coli O144]APT62672.1 hypothetical protein BUE82_12340 [Escherichia coli]EFD5443137.1 hypothetical protein [Escherichia coli]EFE8015643.1 hypothetical protein [Escherichia coli]EFI7471286.1 hypothetical protein [Escherichia coli]